MTNAILSAEHRALLAGIALSNVLLAFDFDGTLAPIAPTPGEARMRPCTQQLLSAIAVRYPCVVISGRALDDVAGHLSGVPVWHLFGNHGLECGTVRRPPAAETRIWVDRLRHELSAHPGVVVEDKGLTVTVHYRGAEDRQEAMVAIDDAVKRLPGARVVGGKEAVNLLPAGDAGKGVALREALRRFACHSAIYIGDDASDEDAFAAAGPDRVLGIRVGAASASAARYHVETQADIDTLLQLFIELRARPERA
jgi:trehalose 6-phosphate phosphatase